MKFLRVVTVVTHFMVGALGLMGGYAAVSSPEGPFGISTDVLKNGPFTSFLIPGLALLIVIGIGQILTAVIVIRKSQYYPYVEGAMAAITIGWILIQCWVMQEINWMHVTIFTIGALQGIGASLVIIKDKMFPVNLFLGRLTE